LLWFDGAQWELVHGQSKLLFPSELTFADRARLGDRMLGLYDDGWCAPSAQFRLGNPGGYRELELAGAVPDLPRYRFPIKLAITTGGQPAGELVFTRSGDFSRTIPLPESVKNRKAIWINLEAGFSFTGEQIGLNDDRRPLAYRFARVALRN